MKSKILAIIEVSFIFFLLVLIFWTIQSFPIVTNLSRSFDGLNFSGYAALLIFSIPLYLLRCRSQTKILISEKLVFQREIIKLGFFPVFTLSMLLSWIDWTRWKGLIIISLIEIGLLFWFAWVVRNTQPGWQKIGAGSSLLLFPILTQFPSRIGSVIISIIYFYLLVALSEEILFRGYIQSRLDSVFGQPKQFFGIRWGFGLILSSILFGFWHAGWFSETLAWSHVIWTIFAGLLLGLVREKSGSVIAPAFLHGIINYGPQAVLFYLFWGM